MATDVIYADRFLREQGYLEFCSGDFEIGVENSFELKVPPKLGIAKGSYLMIEDTEYGGIVDGVEIDTTQRYITVDGRTWHGMLEGNPVVPDKGQDYLIVSGDCNAVLGTLITRLGLTDCLAAEESPSGIVLSNYRFSRVSSEMGGYSAIRAMLRSVGAKLRIAYSSQKRRAVLSALQRASHIEDGADGDQADFVIKETRPVNHLYCMGKGELKDRAIVNLYADKNGAVSKTQTLFGVDHICEVYDSPESDEAQLEEEGAKYLKELQADMSACTLQGVDDGLCDIDDIVGGESAEPAVKVVTTVAAKIATVAGSKITYETKTALEV